MFAELQNEKLTILQQSDLKTQYRKDSVMRVLKIFAWLVAKASFKPISVLITFLVTKACHLVLTCSSCHGDVDAEQIAERVMKLLIVI